MVVVPITNLLVPPLWGFAADVLRARLVLLRVAVVGSGLAVLLLLPNLGLAASIAAMAVFSVFRAPLTSLADAASVDALQGQSQHFSRVRVWGSLGFAAFVATLGWLGASSRPTLLLVSTAIVYLLASAATAPLKEQPIQHRPGVITDVGRVLRRASVIAFLAATAIYYLGHSMYDVFFGLHAKALGLGDDFVGTAWAIGVCVEVVLLTLAPRFLHLLRTEHMLVACAIIATVRWLVLAHFVSPWVLLASQGLHGVTFGLWYLSLVSFVQTRADRHMRTTLQSIALSCVGLGMAGGYLLGGALFEHHGGTTLYCTAAAAAALSIAGYVVAARLVKNRALTAA
jgi:predicted MFS family arabinose efflux permease